MNRRRLISIRSVIISICAVVVAAVLLGVFTLRVSEASESESERIAREAIIRALITCYATEGSFPSSIEHLEEHYGIIIDHEKFVVHYEATASNIMPHVRLIPRNP